MPAAIMSELGLTKEQTRILFSIDNQLIKKDIEHEPNASKKNVKAKWNNRWINSVNAFIRSMGEDGKNTITMSRTTLRQEIKKIGKSSDLKNRTPLYLILLEATLFSPYYPLKKNEKLKKLKFRQDNGLLEGIASDLSIPKEYILKYKNAYKTATRGITHFWQKALGGSLAGAIVIAVTAGLAAPVIAGLFAPAALAGAAATSAGLAALGGGAIAAGGAGMAGGIMTIVAGGALLGAGTGLGVGRLLAASPKFTLSEAARLEVVMKEITLTAQKDVRMAQEMIHEQRKTLRSMRDRLFDLERNKEENKKKIKNLKKSIKYLKTAIERNRDLAGA